jgi:hypothetical protein
VMCVTNHRKESWMQKVYSTCMLIQDKHLCLLDFCKFEKVTLMVLFLNYFFWVPTTLKSYEQ